jgi:cobalt/nickel transport system ATP-binding protein
VQAPKLISVDNLVYTYPGGVRALDGISLAVAEGERVGVVGPNGAGKTSLFLCLAGVLKARAEILQVGGLNVLDRQDRKRLPAVVGIVFQHSDDQLFSATVADDVAFGPLNLGLPADEVQARVKQAIDQVGLQGREDRPPFHLSGGEKRRAALAGVLAMRPSLLLLDEPSTDLDPRGRRELMGLLSQVAATRLLASHDLELILATSDRVLLLEKGRLVADGPARIVLADEALMEAHGLEVPHSLRGK